MISGWAPARPPRAVKHQDIACFLVKVRLAHMARSEFYSHDVGSGLRRVSGQNGDRQVRAEPARHPVYIPLPHNLHDVFRWLCRCAGRRGTTSEKYNRSEEHTSELQSLMRISYAVFCLKKHTDTRPLVLHIILRHKYTLSSIVSPY